jgi:hypothetical protein
MSTIRRRVLPSAMNEACIKRGRLCTLTTVVAAMIAIAAGPVAGSSLSADAAAAWSAARGSFAGQVAIGGGRRLYLTCAGTGSPTVILESGVHDSSDTWTLTDSKPPVLSSPSVFRGVARYTHVCIYDRPGTIRYTNPLALTGAALPRGCLVPCPGWW